MALLPCPAESWVMPGSAAETRADTCRSSGATTSRSRCRCATGLWAVQPSRCPASAPASRRRRGCWSPGPAPDLEGRRWAARPLWSEPVGPLRASGLPCSPAPSPLSRLGDRAWRRPASRRAGQDRPAVAATACALACGAAWVFARTSRPPPTPAPAAWVALLLPCSRRNETNHGPVGVAPARQAATASHPQTRISPSSPPGGRPPVANGLARSSESMTTPTTRGRREPGCRQGPQPIRLHVWIHHAPLPRPRGLGVIALSPVADVGRADEYDYAHQPDGPDRAVPPTVDVAGPSGWPSAGLCGQAARCGAGSGPGSGSGIGGCGRDEGAPGQLTGVWSPELGWLVGPLSR
jgi:hypothetical protein